MDTPVYNIAINPCGIGGTETFSRVLNRCFSSSTTYSFKTLSMPYFDAPFVQIHLKEWVAKVPKSFRWIIPRHRRYNFPLMENGIIILNALTDIERIPRVYFDKNKVIYVAHNEPSYIERHRSYLGRRKSLRLKLMKKVDLIISLSSDYNEQFSKLFSVSAENVKSVAHTVDIETAKTHKVSPNTIITICRLDNTQKRLDRFTEVAKAMPNHCFEIYGMGKDQQFIEEMIKGVPNICFKGKTNNIRGTHEGAGIFLMTSDYEGLSIAVLESLSQATPVIIAKNCFAMAKIIIKEGFNGFVDDEFSVERVVAHIRAIEENYEQYSRNALESFTPYNNRSFIKQWEENFNSIVS